MGQWLSRNKDWLSKPVRKSPGRPLKNDEEYGVPFIPLRCPRCQSKNIKCYSSHLPIRYHACRDCGYNFKSVEREHEK